MKILALITFTFICIASNAQCILYNQKGQLETDTSYSISPAQLKIWCMAEQNIILLTNTIEYPPICSENNLECPRILVVSFYLDSTSIRDVKVLNGQYIPVCFIDAMEKGLLKKSNYFVTFMVKEGKERRPGYSPFGTYYIPVNFELIKFYDEMKKHKAVPIIGKTVPLIDWGIY